MDIRERIERARQAQQSRDQKHDVQLEIVNSGMSCDACGKPLYGGPLQHLPHDVAGCPAIWIDEEDDVDFNQLRQAQLEFEVGRDPRD